MFGTKAFVIFTMDKFITTITRQMQNFVTDEANISSVDLFEKYCSFKREKNTEDYLLEEHYEAAAKKVCFYYFKI